MRWFMDTEFDENGSTIKLISIALVNERGRGFYRALCDGWSPHDCNDWVKENVLPKLPPVHWWETRASVRDQIRELLLVEHRSPEIWGYYSDYDWVVFCQLFGRMVDLPSGMPMYCRDLKQEMDRLGITREQLPPQEPKVAHDALADAQWIRSAWLSVTGNLTGASTTATTTDSEETP